MSSSQPVCIAPPGLKPGWTPPVSYSVSRTVRQSGAAESEPPVRNAPSGLPSIEDGAWPPASWMNVGPRSWRPTILVISPEATPGPATYRGT